MSTFDEIQDELSQTDRVTWLGQMVWYGVSEVRVAHNAVVAALVKCKLGGYLPRPPSDVDVFRRVCSAAQRKRVPDLQSPTVFHNYLVRDLPMDSERVHKVLVRETVQPGNLKYQAEVACLDFLKTAGIVDVIDPGGLLASDLAAQMIVSDIESTYAAERGVLNSYAVRELIRRVLLNVNAVNVRGKGGGLYFVPSEHNDTVDSLELFAKEIPGVVLIQSVPLQDNAKQREMLKAAYELESIGEIDNMIDEITGLVTEVKAGLRKVTNDRVLHYTGALSDSKGKAKTYSGVLETSLDSTASRIQIFQQLVMQLATMVQ